MAKRLGFTKRDLKNINVIVGQNLAAARRNAGMSQTDVMKAVWGVSDNRNRISEIETGKKELTLPDLLIFQDLYGQSMDYILGLSCEPELDMLSGTVNHVFNQSKSLIEMLTGELASVMVKHIKSIAKNDYEALLDSAKRLCQTVKTDNANSIATDSPTYQAIGDVMQTIRSIEVKQARQAQAVDMQMIQIAERIDKEDRHALLDDRDQHYEHSISLVKPKVLEEEVVVDTSSIDLFSEG